MLAVRLRKTFTVIGIRKINSGIQNIVHKSIGITTFIVKFGVQNHA